MIDIQLVRDNPELVKKKSAQKGIEVNIDKLLKLDEERKELLVTVEGLRQKRNSAAIATKGGKPDQKAIDQGKLIKVELAEREKYLKETEELWRKLHQQIPNMLAEGVPVGDEQSNLELSQFGDKNTGAIDHLEFAEKRGWVDFERGAKVAASKFYFLRGDLALLENAITQFALDFVLQKNFTLLTVPHMVNSLVASGVGFAPRSNEQSDEYFIEGEDLSLIATSEMPLTGYHANEIIDESDLPLFYVGQSPCYRKEAGTYGKHTRGLFRVHQFNKLEMYAFCSPEQSDEIHEKIREIEEELWKALEIPYRVVNVASGDLGAQAAKKYDIEYWSKADGNYRELTSCSNCTDFQARNLNIRLKRKDGSTEFLHTLNGTAVALARSLVAIIEHYQTDDGKLRVPKVLRQYMGGRETI